MNKIGIFQGKQEKHNRQILTLLYDNGPLTAWEITGKIQNYGKQSLHATLNKRLRDLEKKNYVQRGGRKWFMGFKGFIAVLMIQPQPKVWSTKWTQLIDEYTRNVGKHAETVTSTRIVVGDVTFKPFEMLKNSCSSVRDFDSWLQLSGTVKTLMQTGVINLDVIKDKVLLNYIFLNLPLEQINSYVDQFSLKDKK